MFFWEKAREYLKIMTVKGGMWECTELLWSEPGLPD